MQITPKQSEALELQNAGLTYSQIAEKLDISVAAVEFRLRRARNRLGIPILRIRAKSTEPTQRQEQVIGLKSQGLKTSQIAERLGIHSVTVIQHLRNARIRGEEG